MGLLLKEQQCECLAQSICCKSEAVAPKFRSFYKFGQINSEHAYLGVSLKPVGLILSPSAYPYTRT